MVKQLDKKICGKFSYCLVPIFSEPNVSSKLNSFYFLNLENVFVRTKTLVFHKKTTNAVDQIDDGGNIIIDSGMTLSFLPRNLHQELE